MFRLNDTEMKKAVKQPTEDLFVVISKNGKLINYSSGLTMAEAKRKIAKLNREGWTTEIESQQKIKSNFRK